MTPDRFDEQAHEIVCRLSLMGQLTPLIDAIAAALRAAATAPEGCVIDGGVVRKVLGTLPITADGCVVGDGAVIHMPCADGCVTWRTHQTAVGGDENAKPEYWGRFASKCYSTPEAAAEAAQKGAK